MVLPYNKKTHLLFMLKYTCHQKINFKHKIKVNSNNVINSVTSAPLVKVFSLQSLALNSETHWRSAFPPCLLCKLYVSLDAIHSLCLYYGRRTPCHPYFHSQLSLFSLSYCSLLFRSFHYHLSLPHKLVFPFLHETGRVLLLASCPVWPPVTM